MAARGRLHSRAVKRFVHQATPPPALQRADLPRRDVGECERLRSREGETESFLEGLGSRADPFSQREACVGLADGLAQGE